MKKQLFAISLLLGWSVALSQMVKADDIRVETSRLSVIVGTDGRITINSNPRWGRSLSDRATINSLDFGRDSQILRSSMYPNLNIEPSTSRLCQGESRQYQSTYHTHSSQVYSRNTMTTRVCP